VFDPGTRGIGVMFGSIALAAAGIRLAAWLKGRQARNMAAA
jgi:hypothetical protein